MRALGEALARWFAEASQLFAAIENLDPRLIGPTEARDRRRTKMERNRR
jgi:hypothetical protein